MAYKINMSFYEGNTLHEAGATFEHEDKAYVEKLLADGNIAETGGSESELPLAESPVASVIPESQTQEQANPVAPEQAPQAVTRPPKVPTQEQLEADVAFAEQESGIVGRSPSSNGDDQASSSDEPIVEIS